MCCFYLWWICTKSLSLSFFLFRSRSRQIYIYIDFSSTLQKKIHCIASLMHRNLNSTQAHKLWFTENNEFPWFRIPIAIIFRIVWHAYWWLWCDFFYQEWLMPPGSCDYDNARYCELCLMNIIAMAIIRYFFSRKMEIKWISYLLLLFIFQLVVYGMVRSLFQHLFTLSLSCNRETVHYESTIQLFRSFSYLSPTFLQLELIYLLNTIQYEISL